VSYSSVRKMTYILDTRTYTQKSINLNFAMVLLKPIRTAITSILLTAILTITVTTSIQAVFAPRGCSGCIKQFQILTRSFGADAGKIILTEHSFPISKFIQLNLKFEKNIIKAVYAVQLPPDPTIPDLIIQYGKDLLNLHPPDSIKPLLLTYQQDLSLVFAPR